MFGYIRPLRDELRVCDNELYEALYCGICRDLRLRYGAAATAALSYDLVFLTVLETGLAGKSPAEVNRPCPAHPLKGKSCARCMGSMGTSYAADCGVILAYAKLTDDLRDRAPALKLRAAVMLPLLHGYYTKAAKARPSAASAVKICMEQQRRAEKGSAGPRSLDRLSEPSAAMLSALFRELGGYDPDLRVLFSGLGYMLGRYIYICDALDDLDEDIQSGDVNPFAPAGADIGAVRERAAAEAEEAVNLTLGQLGGIYSRLPENARTPLADNIIYSGLRGVFGGILRRTRGQSLGGR